MSKGADLRRQRIEAEKAGPTLPRPCECPTPLKNYDADGFPYCFRCSRSVIK